MTREEILLKRLKKGEPVDIEELVTFYYPHILRYCIAHTRDRQMAEDAVQETFYKAVRHIEQLAKRGKFKSWLYQIASNVCSDQLRKEPEGILPEVMPYQESGFRQSEDQMVLIEAMQDLSRELREIIYLRYMHGLTLRETAAVMELPLRTVQSRQRLALRQMKKSLIKGEN